VAAARHGTDPEATVGQKAAQGDTVSVHYTGTLESGEVFDSSRGRDPLEFQMGAGQVIAGFDRAVEGLEVGDSRTVRIEPEAAYGVPQDHLVIDVPHEQFPSEIDPAVGQQIQVQVAPGEEHVARITDVQDDAVRLDLNHPLAGETLTFEVELVSIR
jgi:peptidylprolyl isomerase